MLESVPSARLVPLSHFVGTAHSAPMVPVPKSTTDGTTRVIYSNSCSAIVKECIQIIVTYIFLRRS